MDAATLKSKIRTVRDWPKPGVNFRDVTTLFQDAGALQATVDALAAATAPLRADLVAAVDARGFIVGGVLAYKLGKPFVLVRKKASCPTRPWRRATRWNTGPPPSKCMPMPAGPVIAWSS